MCVAEYLQLLACSMGSCGLHSLSRERLTQGGGQEGGRRAGTESVVLIAALGKACEIARSELEPMQAHMRACSDRLRLNLIGALGEDNVRINGPKPSHQRLPNTLSIGVIYAGFKRRIEAK